MSQTGKMSAGECAEWFYEKMNYHFKIHRSTVWRHWNKPSQNKVVDIHDLLDKIDKGEIEIEDFTKKIDNKEVEVK